MGLPGITEDQREMAVEFLANAIRKDAHLRARAEQVREHGDPLTSAMASRRAEPSQRYVDGMGDLLRVMFADGRAVTDECLEEAYSRAVGASTPASNNGMPYH